MYTILFLFSFTSINTSHLDKQQVNLSTLECTYNQCKAIAKSTEKETKSITKAKKPQEVQAKRAQAQTKPAKQVKESQK